MKVDGLYWGEDLLECNEMFYPIVENFLYHGEVICIAAQPKMGKSVFIQQLMFNLTTGKDWLDRYRISKPCNVLYVQAEGTRYETVNRFKIMLKTIELDQAKLVHMNRRDIDFMTETGVANFIRIASIPNIKYDVIVLDPLYKLMSSGDLNNAKDVSIWTNNVDRIFRYFGCAGIIIHHDTEKIIRNKKGEIIKQPNSTLFGSTFWSGFFSSTYKLLKTKDGILLTLGIQRSGFSLDNILLEYVVPQKDEEGRLFFKIKD